MSGNLNEALRWLKQAEKDLAPFEYYEKEDAEECINYAGLILGEVKKYIKR